MSEMVTFTAVQKKDFKKLKYLIDNGYDLNIEDDRGNTPLHIASLDESRINVVAFLLENGTKINARNKNQKTPLHIAALRSNVKIVQLLIEHGANIISKDKRGRIPFNYAVNEEIAKLFIEHRCDINAKDRTGLTLLHEASSTPSKFKLIKFLIERGADPKIRSKNGVTPLHLAVGIEGNLETVKLLVKNGADINAKDFFGETPFLRACQAKGNLKVVKFLHQIGANVNVQDIYKNGPLHQAACKEEATEVIEFLLKIGADLKEQNFEGKTPLCMAAILANSENVEFLLQNGADVLFNLDTIQEIKSKENNEPNMLEVIVIVHEHLLKLKMLNLVDENIFDRWTFLWDKLGILEEAYQKEAEHLKEIIGLVQKVSFSDLLTKSVYVVAVLMNDDYEMNKKLSQINYYERFPIYASLLERKIKRCRDLARLLTLGKWTLTKILGDFRIPDLLLNNLMQFFNENDLQNMNRIFSKDLN